MDFEVDVGMRLTRHSGLRTIDGTSFQLVHPLAAKLARMLRNVEADEGRSVPDQVLLQRPACARAALLRPVAATLRVRTRCLPVRVLWRLASYSYDSLLCAAASAPTSAAMLNGDALLAHRCRARSSPGDSCTSGACACRCSTSSLMLRDVGAAAQVALVAPRNSSPSRNA
jgi:hypothetical protein